MNCRHSLAVRSGQKVSQICWAVHTASVSENSTKVSLPAATSMRPSELKARTCTGWMWPASRAEFVRCPKFQSEIVCSSPVNVSVVPRAEDDSVVVDV